MDNSEEKSIEVSIKNEFRKMVILLIILSLSVGIFMIVNKRYENKFKREFELPGQKI